MRVLGGAGKELPSQTEWAKASALAFLGVAGTRLEMMGWRGSDDVGSRFRWEDRKFTQGDLKVTPALVQGYLEVMAPNPTLAEISALRAAVKELLRKAARWDWRPNKQEASFLRAMADFFGPHLPPPALTSRTVFVAYLRTARDSLESAFQRLIKEAQPGRTG